MQATLQIVGSAFAAAFAWIMLEFVGRPIRKFFDIRGEIIRKLVEFANVSAKFKAIRDKESGENLEVIDLTQYQLDRLAQAEQVFRDLAAQMHAFSQNETFARWAVARILRYKPQKAAMALIGLSNSYDTYGETKAFQRKELYSALRIKGGPVDVL
jgi:hypothetical protein